VGSQKPGGACHTAIAGLGATGSAAAWILARRGVQVLGFEQHAPLHTLGSSHGRSRIIREAYFEHPLYVPMVQRACELWAELERETGQELVRLTGGLMLGRRDGAVFAGALRSAREHGLAHEELTAEEVRRRFPVLVPDDDMAAVLEPRAGLLFPEDCVQALQSAARAHGAVLAHGQPVTRWEADDSGVTVTTPAGRHRAGQLILSAGPWLPRLVEPLVMPLQVERQLSHWFEPAGAAEAFDAGRCPVTIWEHSPGRIFYTIPDPGGQGLKAGIHHEGETVDPDTVRREPTAEDEARIRDLLARFMPAANGRLRDARVCLYTNTPDGHFVIDRHPGNARVILASPCSGHGFKFATAVGEALADLVTNGRGRFDLSPFRADRFR
jgi:sarcosine oxidase